MSSPDYKQCKTNARAVMEGKSFNSWEEDQDNWSEGSRGCVKRLQRDLKSVKSKEKGW
jgi:hypothetical protein